MDNTFSKIKERNLSGLLMLGGKGGESKYINYNSQKEKRIEIYQFYFLDSCGISFMASHKNEEQVLIEYHQEYIKAVYRYVCSGEDNRWCSLCGTVCGIWQEKKSGGVKWHYVWFNLEDDAYKHFVIESMGFDDEMVLKCFNLCHTFWNQTLCNGIKANLLNFEVETEEVH